MPRCRAPALACVLAFAPAALAQLDPADEVFYQFMPIAWRDSNNDQYRYGDFNGMTASLDYLQSLGVTCVWMNPIHPTNAYHGYQHGPINLINPSLGTEAEFLNFVAQAKARGIKVFIDAVCYQVSTNQSTPNYFGSAYNNPASPYDTWLAFTNAGNTTYDGGSYNTWTGASVGVIDWDLRTAATRNQVIAWCQHWLDPNNDGDPSDGIAGYRLDHVLKNNDHGPSGWGYNIDSFWIPWKQGLQSVNPNVFTFTEQADWGSYGADLLPAHDAAFTKPFEFAARDALLNENATNLYASMASTVAALPTNLGSRTFLATIGDHDVDRLASVIGSTTNFNRAKAAAAVLMLQPFPPIIYYGDEIGMTGTKGNYGSDANDIPMREPFKWLTTAAAPMSNYFVRNSQAYNNRFERNGDGRSVQEQQGVSGSLLETYKTLSALRHAQPALRRGSYNPVPASGSKVWSFIKHHAPAGGPTQTLLVAINVSGTAQNTSLNFAGFTVPQGGSPVTDIQSGANLTTITAANQGAYTLSVPSYSYRVLTVSVEPPTPPVSRVDGVAVPTDLGIAGDDSGALYATQQCATSFGDNTAELDQLFARATSDGVYIGLSGNIPTDATALALFIDSRAGGQNVLNTSALAAPPGGLQQLTGLKFDAGFAPDDMLFINASGGNIYADAVVLPTSGSGTKTYRGQGTTNNGAGFLTGGSNPNGLQVAIDTTNTGGVTGSSAANAATATKGVELYIPFADLQLTPPLDPCRTVTVAAFLVKSDGTLGNQVLPALPAGTAALGLAPDFTTRAGSQFVSVLIALSSDFDQNGFVNGDDFDTFTAAFIAGDPAADFDANTFVNGDDFDLFIASFVAGC